MAVVLCCLCDRVGNVVLCLKTSSGFMSFKPGLDDELWRSVSEFSQAFDFGLVDKGTGQLHFIDARDMRLDAMSGGLAERLCVFHTASL